MIVYGKFQSSKYKVQFKVNLQIIKDVLLTKTNLNIKLHGING
jgi:hypothetical protein